MNGTTKVNSSANEQSRQADLDELMIDETLVHDIDEQFDEMTRKNTIEHKIRNRRPRRRVSSSDSGTKLGTAGVEVRRAEITRKPGSTFRETSVDMMDKEVGSNPVTHPQRRTARILRGTPGSTSRCST